VRTGTDVHRYLETVYRERLPDGVVGLEAFGWLYDYAPPMIGCMFLDLHLQSLDLSLPSHASYFCQHRHSPGAFSEQQHRT
jgi:heme oxygenase